MKTIWLFEFDLEGSFDYAKAKEYDVIAEYDDEYFVEHRPRFLLPTIRESVNICSIDSEDQFYPKRSFYSVWFSSYEKGLAECSKVIDERIAESQRKIKNFELMKKQLEEK